MGIERRQSKRSDYVGFVWYKRIGGDDEEDPLDEGVGHSTDLSMTGLGLVTPRPLHLHRRYFFSIITPKGRVSVVGKVVNERRGSGETMRCGVLFEIIAPSDLPTLQDMVSP